MQANRYRTIRFDVVEYESRERELQVVGPESSGHLRMFLDDRDNNQGRGLVYSREEEDSESERDSMHIADVTGLFLYINDNQVERVSTNNFREHAEIDEDRRFANPQLHLRGVWNRGRGEEVAIVGGTEGLAGARGVVRYSYRLTGDFQVLEESQSF